jgi:hypothetical protein
VPESTAPVATAETADTPQTPPREPGARLVRVTAVVALVSVLLALVGLGLGLRPLATPTQDCGTAATFLLQGRVNEYVNPADPPSGITRAEAEANNAEPCQERAGNRALPAGVLLVGGTLVAAVAVLVESVVRFRLHRASNRRLAADPEL